MPHFKDLNTRSAIEFSRSENIKRRRGLPWCVLGFISMRGHNSPLDPNWPAGTPVWETKASCHPIIISNQHVSCFRSATERPPLLPLALYQADCQCDCTEWRGDAGLSMNCILLPRFSICNIARDIGALLCAAVKMQRVNVALHPGGWPAIQMEMHNCDAELTLILPRMTEMVPLFP